MSASTEGQDEGAGISLSGKFSPISQLSATFLVISQPTVNFSKSQLIFFLYFLLKKSQTLASINIRSSAACATTHLFLKSSEH